MYRSKINVLHVKGPINYQLGLFWLFVNTVGGFLDSNTSLKQYNA